MLEGEKVIVPTPSPANESSDGYLNNRKIGPGVDCNSNREINRDRQK
jgi:hypothetical protein